MNHNQSSMASNSLRLRELALLRHCLSDADEAAFPAQSCPEAFPFNQWGSGFYAKNWTQTLFAPRPGMVFLALRHTAAAA
jgi:hypothetical protein